MLFGGRHLPARSLWGPLENMVSSGCATEPSIVPAAWFAVKLVSLPKGDRLLAREGGRVGAALP